MIKNITVYLCLLLSVFAFNIFYYAWFSWFLLLCILLLPAVSLAVSLPFMIISAVNGIIVFSKKSINIDDDFYIGVAGKKRRIPFCPLLRIKMKVKNNFANYHNKIKITYGGTLTKAIFEKHNRFSKHCGCVELSAKYCKVYDFMGLFFIPIKINANLSVEVMPKPVKPTVLPNCDSVAVLGYKPKSGGGFSDFYELRQYQNGDSIKNIHWKLSSKQDDLIVREPCQPIFRKLAVKLIFTNDNNENDNILARFLYACDSLFDSGNDCCVMCNKVDFISHLANSDDVTEYIKSLYQGVTYNEISTDSNLNVYSIYSNSEEVRAI